MKKVLFLIIAVAGMLVFLSCGRYADPADDMKTEPEVTETSNAATGYSPYEKYTYPENPTEELRNYLKKNAGENGIPIRTGDILQISDSGSPQKVFSVGFLNNPENECVVSFAMNEYYLLDGKDNPSFRIAFKDPDNTQDLITFLSSVLMYLSPGLSTDEAERLAMVQNRTISTDGYSMPLDVGGYQVQTRYTKPHVFIRTNEFDSMMGITVTALKQTWGAPDINSARELVSPEDYSILASIYRPEGNVYADFIIRDVSHLKSIIHGDFWIMVLAESMAGETYTLRVENMQMIMDYEFGVGQKYTLYIDTGSYYGQRIYFAVQLSEEDAFNRRGEYQPIAYPEIDPENRKVRIDPETNGIVHNVIFYLHGNMLGEPYAALHGQGIGEKQWQDDPTREGYEFTGWYDNPDGTGIRYTKDTPIFEDTELYAVWKYNGPGGYWPRDGYGIVDGIAAGDRFQIGQKVSITIEGYNMDLDAPKDQRFRWIPVSWKVSDNKKGEFLKEAPFAAEFSIEKPGDYVFEIVYKEEIFDGLAWQETGQLREVKERSFSVENK